MRLLDVRLPGRCEDSSTSSGLRGPNSLPGTMWALHTRAALAHQSPERAALLPFTHSVQDPAGHGPTPPQPHTAASRLGLQAPAAQRPSPHHFPHLGTFASTIPELK